MVAYLLYYPQQIQLYRRLRAPCQSGICLPRDALCGGGCRLSLEVMTLTPRCEHVETSQGVPLTVTGVAQCKVMTEREFLSTAAEQFLGKEVDHIKAVILQTLEGHLRAILGGWERTQGL